MADRKKPRSPTLQSNPAREANQPMQDRYWTRSRTMSPPQLQPDMLTKRSIITKRRYPIRPRQATPAAAAAQLRKTTHNEAALSSLRERIHLLEQANTILQDEQATHIASSRAHANQLAALQAELRKKKAAFELERQRFSRRGMKFLGELQRKMRRVAELKETLATERRDHALALEDLRGELEEERLHAGMLSAEAALQRVSAAGAQALLERAELESKIHRCALQATYKMLGSLDERGELVRILEICREHFTTTAPPPGGSGDPVITQQQVDGGMTTPVWRRTVYPQTPVSLDRQTGELDGCGGGGNESSPAAAPAQGGNGGIFKTPTTNRPRVNEYGSPILLD